jgi:hypothetical protein
MSLEQRVARIAAPIERRKEWTRRIALRDSAPALAEADDVGREMLAKASEAWWGTEA